MSIKSVVVVGGMLLAMGSNALAEDVTVGVHMASYHTSSQYWHDGQQYDYNNINPGLYIRFPSGATIGAFKNSYNQGSVYGGWTFNLLEYSGFTLDLTVGVVSGYQGYSSGSNGVVKPMVLPSIATPELFDGVRGRLSVIPSTQSDVPTVLHLSVEMVF